MKEIFQKKHELWLKMLFTSFALPRSKEADMLEDFAKIEFRHLKWIAKEFKEFDWSRDAVKLEFSKAKKGYEIIEDGLLALEILYPKNPLFERIKADEKFMLKSIQHFKDYEVEAFNKKLESNLDKESLKALIEFLFEEVYKEYELIITYFYSKMKVDNAKIVMVFEDLIDESLFHLKSFALIEAKLGILQIPREVMKEVYQFNDLKKFLEDGIKEEIAAKEQCKSLSMKIKDERLSSFFDFINNQEDFHIELMQEVLKEL